MKRRMREDGFTLVELTVAMTVFAIAAISFFGLYNALVQSTIVAKRQAVALTLATNQMEYLKSLPYDSLIVIGGSIPGTGVVPKIATQTINGVTYTTTTSIDYVDDAADNCGPYPDVATKLRECHGSTAATTTDDPSGGKDYKLGHVKVTDNTGARLAEVDTQIAANVAEANSNKGALFVKVADESGTLLKEATVTVTNSTVTPAINQTVETDDFGLAIIYDLPPDSGNDYVIKASKNGYSSLSTFANSGSLQATNPNQKMLAQQATSITLTLMPQAQNSLIIEAVDTSGSKVQNLKIYVKGGYKRYTDPLDTSYCYDTVAASAPCAASPAMKNPSPLGTSPVTGGDGYAVLNDLPPSGQWQYIFCGDDGASTACKVGTTQYYLVAALPYGGSNPLNPIKIPSYKTTNPVFQYSGDDYQQKVRLVFTTNSNFPRIHSISTYQLSKSATSLTNFSFILKGQKLSCGTSGGCSSSVKLVQNGNTYTASCTGAAAGVQLDCTVNLTGIDTGVLELTVGTSAGSITLPTDPQGGFDVNP